MKSHTRHFSRSRWSGTWPVEHYVVQLPAAIVVESERSVGWGLQVIPTDTASRIPLGVDRRELTGPVLLQDPDRARARPVQSHLPWFAVPLLEFFERRRDIDTRPSNAIRYASVYDTSPVPFQRVLNIVDRGIGANGPKRCDCTGDMWSRHGRTIEGSEPPAWNR